MNADEFLTEGMPNISNNGMSADAFLTGQQGQNEVAPQHETFGQSFMNILKDDISPIVGVGQSIGHTMMGGAQAAASGANAIGLMPDETYHKIYEGINEMNRQQDAGIAANYKNSQMGRIGEGAGEIAGNVGQFMAMPGISSTSAAIAYPANVAAGALLSGAQPVQNESQRGMNALVGGGSALAGRVLGGILGTQVTDPTKQAALKTAEDFNIPVYRSQISDNPLVKAGASFEKEIPGSGAKSAIESQVGKFNSAVLGTIGQEGNAVTPEAMKAADEQIGNVYETMKGKYDLNVTPQFENKLLELNDAAKSLGDQGKEYALSNQVDHVMSKINSGVIDGKTYQGMRSQIGRLLRGPNSSPELGQLQDLLDTHFQAGMTPEDAQVFQTARSQYRNMLSLEKVVANSPNEAISPAKLQGAVKNVFGDYAYSGDGDLQRLSRLGNLLKDSFPNSGTATRNQIYELAKHVAGPAVGVGIGAGEGYREGGSGGAIAGALLGFGANKFGITPYLYSKMSANPSLVQQGAAPIAASLAKFLNQGAQ